MVIEFVERDAGYATRGQVCPTCGGVRVPYDFEVPSRSRCAAGHEWAAGTGKGQAVDLANGLPGRVGVACGYGYAAFHMRKDLKTAVSFVLGIDVGGLFDSIVVHEPYDDRIEASVTDDLIDELQGFLTGADGVVYVIR